MPVVKLSSLAVDQDTDDGEWVDCPSIPGVSLLVRPDSYPAYAIAKGHVVQRLRRKHGDLIPQHIISPALGRLIAEHLLLDWKGFDEAFSKEVAKDVLTKPGYFQVVDAALQAAGAVASAKIEYVDDIAKN